MFRVELFLKFVDEQSGWWSVRLTCSGVDGDGWWFPMCSDGGDIIVMVEV